MTNKNIPSFGEFANKPAEDVNEVILPAGPEDPIDPNEIPEDLIPSLFATIHHKSDKRPNGYTPEDIEDLNNTANAHLPHLQTKK